MGTISKEAQKYTFVEARAEIYQSAGSPEDKKKLIHNNWGLKWKEWFWDDTFGRDGKEFKANRGLPKWATDRKIRNKNT